MKYRIWDNDYAVMVCDTTSRKDAFTAILARYVATHGSDVPEPIMWPVAPASKEMMPDDRAAQNAAWIVINEARAAYNLIADMIPA